MNLFKILHLQLSHESSFKCVFFRFSVPLHIFSDFSQGVFLDSDSISLILLGPLFYFSLTKESDLYFLHLFLFFSFSFPSPLLSLCSFQSLICLPFSFSTFLFHLYFVLFIFPFKLFNVIAYGISLSGNINISY